MPLQKFARRTLTATLAPLFAAAPLAAHASGFSLWESSASGLGNAYTGSTALAEDAATIFYNPAGLTYLPGTNFTGAVDFIKPTAKFGDGGSTASGLPTPAGAPAYTVRPLGGNGGDAGSWAAVPSLFASMQVAPRWFVGIGVNAPFGQKTNYTPDWVGRFQAQTSDIATININPTVAWRPMDNLSLGLGLNYQHIDATFTQAVNYVAQVAVARGGAVAGAVVPAANAEGTGIVRGSDGAWGWNAGLLWQINPKTRLGVSYRSDIRYNVHGTADFSNAPTSALLGGTFKSRNVTSNVTLPDTASVSLIYELDSRWTLMGNVAWTGWSTIKNLTFTNEDGSVLSTTPENFRDTWRFGVGANYKVNDQWLLRTGVAYDQTPVRDATVTPRLPDQSRTWLSIGAQYRISPKMSVDVGYAHLFAKDRPINQSEGSTTLYGSLVGTYQVSVDIVGAQMNYRF